MIRTVYDIWGVFRDVGGILAALRLLSSYFLNPISDLGFSIKAINTLFDVQTEDSTLKKNGKFHFDKFQRIRLICNFNPNKKLKRMLRIGRKKTSPRV